MPRINKLGLVGGVLLSTCLSLHALKIGDLAPPLQADHWFNGEAVDPSKLDGETIYVVEFWATWCPPCKKSIPHLNALHDLYSTQKVVFVGVTTEKKEKVEPFVEKMNMRYRVAIAERDAIDTSWMKGVNGIPHAYVVDTNGVIIWAGHPMDRLDEALAEIIQGTYDPDKYTKVQPEQEDMEKLQSLVEDNRIDEAITFLDEKLSAPDPHPLLYQMKIALLAQADRFQEIKGVFGQMAERFWDDSRYLNQIAWMAVTGPFELCDLETAWKCAVRAADLTKHEDAAILDTLARVYYAVGLLPQAIATQEKALKRTPDEMEGKSLRAVLDYYRSAKKLADNIASQEVKP